MFNIGQSQRRAKRYDAALGTFRRFLALNKELPSHLREEIEKMIAELEAAKKE